MLVGNSETFTAAGDAGGLTAPRWGSDAPTVAIVDAGTGRVMAVGTGTATIYVDTDGIRGTKLIRALPNFGGSWYGRYTNIDCQASEDFLRLACRLRAPCRSPARCETGSRCSCRMFASNQPRTVG